MPITTLIAATESLWQIYYHNRSPKLRDELARNNDKLALKIAYRMSLQCAEPIEDLAQLGRIGLLKAIEKFNPNEGNAFSSFAVPYIRGEIQHFLRDHWQHLKIPRRTFEKAGEVKRDQRRLEAKGRTVALEQVAAAHQIDRDQWLWMEAAVQRKPLVDLENAKHISTSAESDDGILHASVIHLLAQLPKLQSAVVIERYFRQVSEETIARCHDRSIAEIRSLLSEALAQLKQHLEGE